MQFFNLLLYIHHFVNRHLLSNLLLQLPHLMVLHLKKKRIQGKLTRSTQEIDGTSYESNANEPSTSVDVDEPSTTVETTVDVDKDMEADVDEKHELSYMEMVNKDPFFEDPSDMWREIYREEADCEKMLLRKKQKSKLKLKKKKRLN